MAQFSVGEYISNYDCYLNSLQFSRVLLAVERRFKNLPVTSLGAHSAVIPADIDLIQYSNEHTWGMPFAANMGR